MVHIVQNAFDNRSGANATATAPAASERVSRWVWLESALPILGVIVALAGWEGIIRLCGLSPFVLPSPNAVALALVDMVGDGSLLTNLLVTLEEAALGFAIAVVAGVAVGGMLVQSPLLERMLYGYLVALQTMPKIALAPVFVAWFGFGMESKVAIAALIAFFPMLANVVAGLKSCDEGKIDVMRALSAGEWMIFRMVRLPSALPYIFVGLEIAVVFALTGAIVGEFVGSQAGLGYLMVLLTSQIEIAHVFAVVVVSGAIGLTLQTIVDQLRRRILVWAPVAHTGREQSFRH